MQQIAVNLYANNLNGKKLSLNNDDGKDNVDGIGGGG